MPPLPPLECLRFFEAAARRESFAKAAEELHVSSSAVAYRIKVLEKASRRRAVRAHSSWCPPERARQGVSEGCPAHSDRDPGRHGTPPLRFRDTAAETGFGRGRRREVAHAEAADFQVSHPGVVIELETNHRSVDPARRDFDIWIAYVGETAAPRPEGLFEETLYEENLLPVCSPTLIEALGRPGDPVDLHDWPCCTISDGTPTGRTGSRARANRRRTSRGRRASASTAWWSPPPSRAWGRLSDTRG